MQINLKKCISLGVLFAFLGQFCFLPSQVKAQELRLPIPGQMVGLSPAFKPTVLKGIKLDPKNPFRFHFFVDRGEGKLNQQDLKDESAKLIKYFLASLTIPEQDLWVNLSPYEKDRIVPKEFGQTEMGRDLLAQDYLLKQVTASLIYPESQLGREFWQKVYTQAQAKYGTRNIPINTFNKVWIVPEKAVVYENSSTAFVLENHLKVMLEEDYLAQTKNSKRHPGDMFHSEQQNVSPDRLPSKNLLNLKTSQGKPVSDNQSPQHDLANQIISEIVIPALTKEVKEGKNFAQLRQTFYSLILATWYKKKIKDSILNKIYSDRKKIIGLDINAVNKQKIPSLSLNGIQSQISSSIINPQLIYEQYLQAFKKGVYNYIKEEPSVIRGQTVSRKYFSGGVAARISPTITYRPLENIDSAQISLLGNFVDIGGDFAMKADEIPVNDKTMKTEVVTNNERKSDLLRQAQEDDVTPILNEQDFEKRIDRSRDYLVKKLLRIIGGLESFRVVVNRPDPKSENMILVEESYFDFIAGHTIGDSIQIIDSYFERILSSWEEYKNLVMRNIDNESDPRDQAELLLQANNPDEYIQSKLKKIEIGLDLLRLIVKDEFRSQENILKTYKGTKEDPIPSISLFSWMSNKVFGKDENGQLNLEILKALLPKIERAFKQYKEDLHAKLDQFYMNHPKASRNEKGWGDSTMMVTWVENPYDESVVIVNEVEGRKFLENALKESNGTIYVRMPRTLSEFNAEEFKPITDPNSFEQGDVLFPGSQILLVKKDSDLVNESVFQGYVNYAIKVDSSKFKNFITREEVWVKHEEVEAAARAIGVQDDVLYQVKRLYPQEVRLLKETGMGIRSWGMFDPGFAYKVYSSFPTLDSYNSKRKYLIPANPLVDEGLFLFALDANNSNWEKVQTALPDQVRVARQQFSIRAEEIKNIYIFDPKTKRFLHYDGSDPNLAMSSQNEQYKTNRTSTGGIDFNPAQMHVEVKQQGDSFKFDYNGKVIDAAQIVGAKFTISSMTPVTNISDILGVSAN